MKNIAIILLSVGALCMVACAGSPKLEERKEGIIDQSTTIGILNLTVVRVDPNGRKVEIDWKGFNIRSGNAFNVPFETIELKAGDEIYVISDQKAGNNELIVNGKLYTFDSDKQQVLIKFGEGVSLEDGGDYREALKIYDVTPEHLKPKAEQVSGGNG